MSTSADDRGGLTIAPCAYSSVDSTVLIESVQAEYVVRYGGRDETIVDPAEFAPPGGTFLVGYQHGEPVACGGWRTARDGVAEIKRMYVVPSARRQGIAWALLTELEIRAQQAGFDEIWLETGRNQPEALAMYERAGYRPVAAFGHYRDAEGAFHLGKSLGETDRPA